MLKVSNWILALILTLIITMLDLFCRSDIKRLQVKIDGLNAKVEAMQQLSDQYVTYGDIMPIQEDIERLTVDVERLNREPRINRSSNSRIMRVTAYDLSVESCGKLPSHLEYGITASGEHVKDWYTVAAGPELPFGTKVYIPYFKDKPNRGVFTVKDRGSRIRNGCIDVYIADGKECKRFGVKYLEVYVLKDGEY